MLEPNKKLFVLSAFAFTKTAKSVMMLSRTISRSTALNNMSISPCMLLAPSFRLLWIIINHNKFPRIQTIFKNTQFSLYDPEPKNIILNKIIPGTKNRVALLSSLYPPSSLYLFNKILSSHGHGPYFGASASIKSFFNSSLISSSCCSIRLSFSDSLVYY